MTVHGQLAPLFLTEEHGVAEMHIPLQPGYRE
jgi:hypothetical protein